MLNAFTVDVEDYYQVSAFEGEIDRSRWDDYPSRVVANTHRMLGLLERHGVRATFFVLGWVAQRHPGLVQDIRAAGHEVGAHSHWHRLIYDLPPDDFRSDARRCKEVLEKILGEPVTAYRAPSFSITQRSLWALEVLVEEGFRVDSSIFPILHDRYGIPGAEPRIHRISTAAGPLWEFPATVVDIPGLRLPVSGGGYFRLLPLSVTLYCLARVNRVVRAPFVFYVHPWEIDPEQPWLPIRSPVSRFRHYVNLARTERKLETLLGRFRFGRVCDVVQEAQLAAGQLQTSAAKREMIGTQR